MAIPPIEKLSPYNKQKWGYYGELGEGNNVKIRFLQTVITHVELDDITLISQILGSEKWDVRDLFQRDVDRDRVRNDIMPYFRNSEKVKFFNPLTLVLLPMDSKNQGILKKIEYTKPKVEQEQKTEYDVYEREGYYKFMVHKVNQAFAQLKWDDSKCHIVAIDGQHRLSALKRWKREYTKEAVNELASWKIPVVILGMFRADPKTQAPNLLEIVRRTFVYINSTAIPVNDARKILLNDESVNAICTQEFVQHFHSNDNKPITERDESLLPLMFFDWRGESPSKRRNAAPASIKSIEEIHSWFEYYILGDDGSDDQEIELNLTDLIPRLTSFGKEKTLNQEDCERIREQFRKTVLPGLLYFLQNFAPYKKYVTECRKIERQALEESDVSQHAFMKLRFGSHNAGDDIIQDVEEAYDDIVSKFEKPKNQIPETLNREIGLRGLVFAFSRCKGQYEEISKKSTTWLEHAKWFIEPVNEIYGEGWFDSFDNLGREERKFLTHLVFDDAGAIVNYRLEHAEDALGSFLVILIFQKKCSTEAKVKVRFEDIWDEYSTNIKKTIEKGFRKSFRSQFKETFEGTNKQFIEKVRKEAEKATEKRLKQFVKYLGVE